MATLVYDCPHCGANHATFEVAHSNTHPTDPSYNRTGQRVFNVFGWCPACGDPYAAKILAATGAGDPIQVQGDLVKGHAKYSLIQFFPERIVATSPEHVPAAAGRAFVQGAESLADGRYTAAVAMFRRAIDVGTRQFSDEVTAWRLEKRIDKLFAEGLITKDLKDWAHKIRLEGNEAVHELDEPTKEQAAELELFTEMVLTYLYTLPAKVKANLPAEAPKAE